MNVLCLSVTEPGRALAGRLPYRHVHGDAGATLRARWGEVDAFVVVLAVGATVRLVAPLLADKATDPAVVCVDDAGRYAVVVCGGHAGGGNELAVRVAGLLGAEPVVTTATDRLGTPALDQLPGLRAEGDVAAVTAAVLGGGILSIDNELGWPLPDALASLGRAAPPGDPSARAVVTDRAVVPEQAVGGERGVVADRTVVAEQAAVAERESKGERGGGGERAAGALPVVVLRPRSLAVGVGTSTDASPGDVAGAVRAALRDAGLSPAAVDRVATVDRRADHPALVALAGELDAPLVAYAPAVLDAVAVPTPSDVVRQAVGTASVAEAAALTAAGPGATLVLAKRATARVTVAVARRAGPAGSLSVVGLGPGGVWHRTPAAEQAVRQAEVVVGYTAYVEQCRDLLGPAQRVLPFPLGAELARARAALEAAAGGRRVALVCSGDAGVYAMASPLLELAGEAGAGGTPPFAGVEVTVVPGITASLAASAVLGAPLGHDHAVVSLSDLHTPWEQIAARVLAAAEADLVLVLYNPRSRRRTWQIEEARRILLKHRAPGTPVGMVTDAARPGQRVVRTTLGDLPVEEVSMTTCVVVGATTTRMVDGRMVTPRGYDR